MSESSRRCEFPVAAVGPSELNQYLQTHIRYRLNPLNGVRLFSPYQLMLSPLRSKERQKALINLVLLGQCHSQKTIESTTREFAETLPYISHRLQRMKKCAIVGWLSICALNKWVSNEPFDYGVAHAELYQAIAHFSGSIQISSRRFPTN